MVTKIVSGLLERLIEEIKTNHFDELVDMCAWEFSYKINGTSFFNVKPEHPLYKCTLCDYGNNKCENYRPLKLCIENYEKENIIKLLEGD